MRNAICFAVLLASTIASAQVVDYTRLSKDATVPSFHKAGRGENRDKPILSAQEVEDIVAFLATLRYK